MKNLTALFNACVAELDAIDMDYSRNIKSVTVNSRLKRAFGQCCRDVDSDTYTIEVSSRILADHISENFVKDTIIHELLHTCPGCMNHGPEWQRRASVVRRTYGYNLHARSSKEECENAGLSTRNYKTDARYRIFCEACDKIVAYRYHRCGLTKNLERFRCSSCHGPLKLLDIHAQQAAV